MRLIILLASLFILSACMDTADVSSSTEQESSTQIQNNIMDAQAAQDEYKTLQAQREEV